MKRMQSEDPQYLLRKLFQFYDKEFQEAAKTNSFTPEEKACMSKHIAKAKSNSNVNAFAGFCGAMGMSYLIPKIKNNMWIRVPFVLSGSALFVAVGVSKDLTVFMDDFMTTDSPISKRAKSYLHEIAAGTEFERMFLEKIEKQRAANALASANSGSTGSASDALSSTNMLARQSSLGYNEEEDGHSMEGSQSASTDNGESVVPADDWLPMVQIDPDQRFEEDNRFQTNEYDQHQQQQDDFSSSSMDQQTQGGNGLGGSNVGTRWDDYDNTSAFGQQSQESESSLGGRSGGLQKSKTKSWDEIRQEYRRDHGQ
jgi:hypothetical protein